MEYIPPPLSPTFTTKPHCNENSFVTEKSICIFHSMKEQSKDILAGQKASYESMSLELDSNRAFRCANKNYETEISIFPSVGQFCAY